MKNWQERLLEGLSGVSRAYRNKTREMQSLWKQRKLTRQPYKSYDKHTVSAFDAAKKFDKLKGQVPKLRKSIPRSPSRDAARGSDEVYQNTKFSRENRRFGPNA